MSWLFGRLPLGWQIILILALGVGIALLLAPRSFQHLQERGPYSASPTCPPGQKATTTPTECRLTVKAALVERWTEGGSKGSNGSKFVWVEAPGGTRYKFQFPYDGIWNKMAGDSLNVELWRGRVTRVQAFGLDEPSSSNPIWDTDQLLLFALIFGFGLAAMIGLLVLARWLQFRNAQKR